MNEQDIEKKLLLLKHNLPLFAEMCLKVVTTSGELVPFVFNQSQLMLHAFVEQQLKETGMVRTVIVKGRKQGVSTYTAARFLHKAIFNPHKRVYILSHHSDSTKVLFGIVSTFFNNLPEQLKLKLITDNSKEIEFDNHSNYTVATAGSGEIGRGATPHFLHCSEVASYENEDALETGIFKAIASADGTEMFLESTAKGIGNLFHRYAIKAIEGQGRFRLFFLPWYVHEDNQSKCPDGLVFSLEEQSEQKKYNLTNDQLFWRRMEKETFGSDWKFKQEFPSTIQEAFQSSGETFFDKETIYNARRSTITDKNKSLVIGVDPAGEGGDRTVIVWRRGRHVEKYKSYDTMTPMALVSILANIINSDNPQKVFIDVAMGYGTIDRLHELNFKQIVQGVHASEKPADPELFGNKRAEMMFAVRDWFKEGETRIPDDDNFEMDLLCIPEAKENSSGRFFMADKKTIKKQFGKSPDIYDALALTFAYPVRSNIEYSKDMYYNGSKTKKTSEFSSPVMNDFSRGKSPQKKGSSIRWDF
jgi:hypothetical protein